MTARKTFAPNSSSTSSRRLHVPRVMFAFMLALSGSALAAQGTQANACSVLSVGTNGALNGWVPAPNDAWHQDVSHSPVDPSSNTILQTQPNDLAGSFLHPDFSSIQGGAYGIPYNVVDSSKTPRVPVKINLYTDDSDITLAPVPADAAVEGSPVDCTTPMWDQHMIVVDRATCVAYEYWQAQSCKGSWSASNTALWDFSQTPQRPYGLTSADAAGLSVFEGLVRYDEIVAGKINHAIRFTAAHTKNNKNNGFFVAPATHASGTLWGTDNIIGMRIRLRADFDISGYSATNQIILQAMKTYGMILADNGSNMFFQGTPDARWNDDDLSKLKRISASSFEVLQMGTMMDSSTVPNGDAPVVKSFTASQETVQPGTPVVLTSSTQGDAYSYIDNAGFTRGSVTVQPTETTTYTLTSRNAYGSASAAVTVNVQTGDANPGLTLGSIADVTYGVAPFSVSASSASKGTITFSVLSGPATISGNLVTVTGTGGVTIQARQVGSGAYGPSATATSFNVLKPVTLGSLVLGGFPKHTYVGATSNITVTAVDTNGAVMAGFQGTVYLSSSDPKAQYPASYSFQASDAGTHSFPVTLNTAGVQGIAAFNGAILGAEFDIQVDPSPATNPNLTLNSIANVTFGVAPFAVSASSLSTGAISYSVLSGPAVVVGNMLTVTGVGTIVVQASQVSSGNYAASTTTTTFKSLQPITLGALLTSGFPAHTTAGITSAITVSAVDTTGAPMPSFTGTVYISTSDPKATIPASYTFQASDGGKHSFPVTLNTAGTQTITATSGSIAASQSNIQVDGTANPNLSINSIADVTYGAAPFAVSASSLSSGAITYSVNNGPASFIGNMLTVTGFGTVTIQASQAGSGAYTSATATLSFNVLKPSVLGSLVVGGFPAHTSVGVTSNVTVTALDSTGAVMTGFVGTIYLSSSDPKSTHAASYTFQASDSGTHSFPFTLNTAGTQGIAAFSGSILGSQTDIQVDGTDPQLRFSSIANVTYGAAPFRVSASSQSNGAITYSVLGGPANVAGDLLTVTGAGTITLQANQASSGSYAAATTNTSFKALQPATLGSLIVGGLPAHVIAGGASTVVVTAVDNSGSPMTSFVGTVLLSSSDPKASVPVSYTFQASDAGTHSFPVILNTPGVQSITAASGNVVGTEGNIQVEGINPNLRLNFVADVASDATPFAVSATSLSTGAITYSVVSGPATLTGNLLTVTGAGQVTIQASQVTSGIYAGAVSTASFTVRQPAALGSLSVEGFPSPTSAGVTANITVTARDTNGAVMSNFTGTIIFSSSDPKAVLPAPYTFQAADGGTRQFVVTLNTAGTQGIAVFDGNILGAQYDIQVGGGMLVLNNTGLISELSLAGTSVNNGMGNNAAPSQLGSLAMDTTGNVWSVTSSNNAINRTQVGAKSVSFSGGGLNAPVGLAIDGNNTPWVVNSGGSSISSFSSSGEALSGATGLGTEDIGANPNALAIDNAGGVWVTSKDNNIVTHIIGVAAPVIVTAGTQQSPDK